MRQLPLDFKRPVAHRGLHDAVHPENSLGAYAAAIANGYQIELDVRITKDGTVVVCHDNNVQRMTGVDRLISESNTDEIVSLMLLKTDYHIPTLPEVLQHVNGQQPLFIEIKFGKEPAYICSTICAILDGYDGPYVVESFDPRIIYWFRRYRPAVFRGQLSGSLREQAMARPLRWLLRQYAFNAFTRPDFLVYEVDYLPNRVVSRWAHHKQPVYLWTINQPHQVKQLAPLGAIPIFEQPVAALL
jgi:glycerophosphoryl diester phosphodiesterase